MPAVYLLPGSLSFVPSSSLNRQQFLMRRSSNTSRRYWDRNPFSLFWEITPWSCQMLVPTLSLYLKCSPGGRFCLLVDQGATVVTDLFDGNVKLCKWVLARLSSSTSIVHPIHSPYGRLESSHRWFTAENEWFLGKRVVRPSRLCRPPAKHPSAGLNQKFKLVKEHIPSVFAPDKFGFQSHPRNS